MMKKTIPIIRNKFPGRRWQTAPGQCIMETPTGRAEVIAAPDGTIRWIYETRGKIQSSPVIGEDGTLYFVTSYDQSDTNHTSLYLNALSSMGNLLWHYQLLEDLNAWSVAYGDMSPLVGTNGVIYVGTAEGIFYAIDTTGTLIWKYRVQASVYNETAAMDLDQNLYFTAADGYLYSIGKDG
ncbi:MAG: PQQ-like beta-propeller repeat protein, partial [FCB group bacterium]|nr:PQQ-like beta-propeller repeat protein [FCB group bacterium]